MKIYFAGSICGGRDDLKLYIKIIKHLQTFGTVLTEHIGDEDLDKNEKLDKSGIYERDMAWLRSADIVVAEVTTPSLGVGFEIAQTIIMRKTLLCLFRPDTGKSLSAMIAGCPEVEVKNYKNFRESRGIIKDFIKSKSN